MKTIQFVIAFILVGTLGLIPTYESHMAYAEDAPRIIKQNILDELQSLELDKKKDQKKLNKVISKFKKTLDDKFWQDDSYLSMIGKKMFKHEKNIVKNLDKIKSYDFSSIISSLVESDRVLAQNQIDLLPTDTGVKKLDKKLNKINKEMSKGQKDFDKNKFAKAIDHFKKAWKVAKMGEDVDVPEFDTGFEDFSNDNVPDYYYNLQYTGKDKKPVIVNYKIQDECVDRGPKDPKNIGGDTYDDAGMRIGVSDLNKVWIVDGMKVWNDWFKKNDDNKEVDLSYSPVRKMVKYETLDSDNVIVQSDKGESFTHFESIPQLEGQSGWDGSLYFNAPPGDYILWTIHPAGGIDECDRLATLGLHVVIP